MPEIPSNPRTADVLLISMPFGPLLMPSIGLGLLKAALLRDGISTRDLYFTLDMARRIGVEAYMGISTGPHSTTDLLGEWIFERELHGSNDAERELAYLRDVIGGGAAEHSKEAISVAGNSAPEASSWMSRLVELRDQRSFLDACLQEVLSSKPRVVGFTSAFQQNVASLALARRIKEVAPWITICMGGSNCEGAMAAELMRQFPYLDVVLSGEGDKVFPEFVAALLEHRPLPSSPGLHHRFPSDALSVLQSRPCSTPAIDDLDSLPVPDYAGFFERFERTPLDRHVQPHVLFESSRGCYWGAVSHCTFCGLNGGNMSYRAKSPGRAMEELATLVALYPGAPVTVVDNILSMGYFRDFVPELAQRKLDLRICYEVKANLSKEQVRLLARAGIRDIQPGIESLSTPILKLMKKGCTGLQNIQLLKWCRELGVRPIWNVLWGFPNEDPAEYAAMAGLVPRLSYLEPPQAAASLRLDRFSPMFDDAAGFGCTEVRPYPSYARVYDLPEPVLRNLAYYFRFSYADGRDPNSYALPLKQAVDEWQASARPSYFFLLDSGECLLVVDLRPVSKRVFYAFTGIDRLLYLACDAIQGTRSLEQMLAASGFEVEREEMVRSLERMAALGLLMHEGNQWLALAISAGEYVPPRAALQAAKRAAEELADPAVGQPGLWRVARVNAQSSRTSAETAGDIPDSSAREGLLTGGHVRLTPDGDVLLDTRDLDRRAWEETRLRLAGVSFQ